MEHLWSVLGFCEAISGRLQLMDIDSNYTEIVSYLGCAISSHLFHYQHYSWDDVNLKESLLCSNTMK